MMANTYFIAGTDTDVGKTYITALLTRALREQGINAIAFKPVACGSTEDAQQLFAAYTEVPIDGIPVLGLEIADICPVYFQLPASPYTAMKVSGYEEQANSLVQEMNQGLAYLQSQFDVVLIEGVGGWEVPLTADLSMSDWVVNQHNQSPVEILLVADNRLGMLNHTKLTTMAIRARGLACKHLILNYTKEEWTSVCISNRAEIGDWAGVELLTEVIYGQDYLELPDLFFKEVSSV